MGQQIRIVVGNDDELAGRNVGDVCKAVQGNASRDAPADQALVARASIVDLDVFVSVGARDGIEHDLVDDDGPN